MTKPTLVTAAAYIALIGLALLIVPAQFATGAVPDQPSSELLALLRLLGGPLVGIAVLNWMSRKSNPATIRNTVLLANLVAFVLITGNDIVGVATGGARDLAKIFLVIHLAFTIAFAIAWVRAGRTEGAGRTAQTKPRQEEGESS